MGEEKALEKKTFKFRLWQKVIIGMLLGILFGHFAGKDASILKPIGDIYISLIKMIVIPLVFFAVLYGITSLSDAETFGRLGLKAVCIYFCTTVFAVTTGMVFANIFKPGIGVELPSGLTGIVTPETKSLISIFVGMVPSNPIKAMAEGNTVQVVIFAFLTGFSLITIGDKGKPLRDIIVSATNLMFKMVGLVISLTPYGVFALMAHVVGEHGFGIIGTLGKFALVVCGALAFHYCVYGIVVFLSGLNPFIFYKKMTNAQMLAFATASSKATLVTAMSDLRNKMGVSKQSASFILPLGASMNMDATSIYFGICSVFFAQMFGVDLSLTQYVIIIFASTVGSIGAAGFPGGGIIMMGMVLSSVGLPLDGIYLIIGIDRFLEMLRTTINITGDCMVTLIVDNMEGTLNKKIYNDVDVATSEKATL
ncbi:Dicarboxylate/amino acid:cation symporter [Candidatus Cyrtobacter comes]|uniref:Dicarboxylate/amino acid:cation symporter n=1 Tax=Candidatus Cyrtobacter comes TaxID=675776 RepID=A0ABU5L7B7_9RICK|nr:dicarboxylate/amino acid:cation symporter [Candidatus Cyrtobacter comes]MDZ5762015.1 Dicarboxylate/amino acid:cation symporter [Candidatus Cyrtobacter comes]